MKNRIVGFVTFALVYCLFKYGFKYESFDAFIASGLLGILGGVYEIQDKMEKE